MIKQQEGSLLIKGDRKNARDSLQLNRTRSRAFVITASDSRLPKKRTTETERRRMWKGKRRKSRNDFSPHNGRSDNESGLDTLLLGLLFMQTSSLKEEEKKKGRRRSRRCVCL